MLQLLFQHGAEDRINTIETFGWLIVEKVNNELIVKDIIVTPQRGTKYNVEVLDGFSKYIRELKQNEVLVQVHTHPYMTTQGVTPSSNDIEMRSRMSLIYPTLLHMIFNETIMAPSNTVIPLGSECMDTSITASLILTQRIMPIDNVAGYTSLAIKSIEIDNVEQVVYENAVYEVVIETDESNWEDEYDDEYDDELNDQLGQHETTELYTVKHLEECAFESINNIYTILSDLRTEEADMPIITPSANLFSIPPFVEIPLATNRLGITVRLEPTDHKLLNDFKHVLNATIIKPISNPQKSPTTKFFQQ